MNIAYTVESARCALGRRLSKGARCRGWMSVAAALLAALCAAPVTQAGPLRPGEILVADSGLEEVEDGAIFRVDPVTGERAIVSGRGVGSGPELLDPLGIAYGTGGQIYVTDRVANGPDGLTAIVYRIDAQSGDRVELSGPNVGGGENLGMIARGLVPYGSHYLLVSSEQNGVAGPPNDGAVFLVDTRTGDRSVVTGPAVGGGPLLGAPGGIGVTEAGDVFVTDRDLFQLDPSTGDRVDVTVSLEPFALASDLAMRDATEVFVADFGGPVIRVTLGTGQLQVVSGPTFLGMVGDGPFVSPYSVAFDSESRLLAYGQMIASFEWALYQVDLPTGDRTVVSGGGVGSGPEFIGLGYFTIVPVPEPGTLAGALAGIAVLALGHWLRRKR